MRRASLVLFAACVTFGVAPAFGCINTFDADIQRYQGEGDAAAVATVIADLEKKYAAAPSLENGNDLGVARLLTGRLDEAIELLRATETKFPGNARVAANLGTALELKGADEEALKWIREGAIRDANEHFGSEWLHARILEAKIAFKQDPKWFEKNRVLALDFGKGEVPVAPEILPIEKGKLKGAEQLIQQIDYQLEERTKFVKPPDLFVGDLYASVGDLTIAGGLSALDTGILDVRPDWYYEEALKYGAPHADLIRKRLARYQADLATRPKPKPKPKANTAAQSDVVDYPALPKAQRTNRALFYGSALAIVLASVGITAFLLRTPRRRSDSQA